MEIQEKDNMFRVKWQVNSQEFSTDWIPDTPSNRKSVLDQFWCSFACFAMIKENVYLSFKNYQCSSLYHNTPVFHDHPGIESSKQLELFDLSQFQLRYVSRRLPNQKNVSGNADQLVIDGLG